MAAVASIEVSAVANDGLDIHLQDGDFHIQDEDSSGLTFEIYSCTAFADYGRVRLNPLIH
jgi:hypothetical protein